MAQVSIRDHGSRPVTRQISMESMAYGRRGLVARLSLSYEQIEESDDVYDHEIRRSRVTRHRRGR